MQTQHGQSLQGANDTKFCLRYLFTNNAFVFKPFNESPRHLNLNRSSSFFKLAGSLPASEEPGISSSVKALAAIRDDQNKQGKATLRTD